MNKLWLSLGMYHVKQSNDARLFVVENISIFMRLDPPIREHGQRMGHLVQCLGRSMKGLSQLMVKRYREMKINMFFHPHDAVITLPR
jgi:hypothetical protein